MLCEKHPDNRYSINMSCHFNKPFHDSDYNQCKECFIEEIIEATKKALQFTKTVVPRFGYSYKTRHGDTVKFDKELHEKESRRYRDDVIVLYNESKKCSLAIYNDGRGIMDGSISPLDIVEELPLKKTFDPTKPVQQRNGLKARIICTDANAYYHNDITQPIIALIKGNDDSEEAESFFANGHYQDEESEYDLINIEE